MALITKDNIKKVDKERNSVHSKLSKWIRKWQRSLSNS